MTDRNEVTLDEAAEFVRFHSTLETKRCDHCVRVGLNTSLQPSEAHGWVQEPYLAEWTLRCYQCRGVREHAWLAAADVERVREWLQRGTDANDGRPFTIDWDDLKRSVM